MKLVTYLQNSMEHLGVLTADETGIVPTKALGLHFADMAELAVTMTDRQRDTAAALLPEKSGEAVPLAQVKLLAPIPRPARDIICLGVNFSEHARESVGVMGQEYGGERKFPIYFAKHVNEAVAPGDPIQGHFDIVTDLDYEVEMAFVVRRDIQGAKAEDAASYVFGYTIMNDVSARCIQMRHKQWFRGKSLDGFAPMGPCLVTADSFSFPPKLNLTCHVNGELRQKCNTELYTSTTSPMSLKSCPTPCASLPERSSPWERLPVWAWASIRPSTSSTAMLSPVQWRALAQSSIR